MRRAFRGPLPAIVVGLMLIDIGAASAQSLSVYGMIVSVRGDVYQVEQTYLRGVSRVLITDQTDVLEREQTTPAILRAGMRIIGEGRRESNGVLQLNRITAADDGKTLSWRDQESGLQPDRQDGPGWFDLAGTIKKLKPGELVDDFGGVIRFDVAPKARVEYIATGRKNVLLIGRRVFINAGRREGDILLASTVLLLDSLSRPGTIFATVERVSNRKLAVLPRFGTDTMQLRIASNAAVYKQISVDPASIHRGDTVSIWGGHSADTTDMSQITAYVIMPGQGKFPASADISEADSGAAGRTICGKVLSLSPFVLKTFAGKTYTVSIPGQTPIARFVPSNVKGVKPGTQTMLVCSQSNGNLAVTTIVIDASPVVAMGL